MVSRSRSPLAAGFSVACSRDASSTRQRIRSARQSAELDLQSEKTSACAAARDGFAAGQPSPYLWNEIENHFGLDPVRCGTDAFSGGMLAWYSAKNVGS